MVNIVVYSEKYVEIEQVPYPVESQQEMCKLIKAILDKAFYSGEKCSLETGRVENEKGIVLYSEIERW